MNKLLTRGVCSQIGGMERRISLSTKKLLVPVEQDEGELGSGCKLPHGYWRGKFHLGRGTDGQKREFFKGDLDMDSLKESGKVGTRGKLG